MMPLVEQLDLLIAANNRIIPTDPDSSYAQGMCDGRVEALTLVKIWLVGE